MSNGSVFATLRVKGIRRNRLDLYLTNGKRHSVHSRGCTRDVAKYERNVRVARGDSRLRL